MKTTWKQMKTTWKKKWRLPEKRMKTNWKKNEDQLKKNEDYLKKNEYYMKKIIKTNWNPSASNWSTSASNWSGPTSCIVSDKSDTIPSLKWISNSSKVTNSEVIKSKSNKFNKSRKSPIQNFRTQILLLIDFTKLE